jgi:acetolactate synthase-1/2/3 large subunit
VHGWQAEHPLEPVFGTDEIKPQQLMYEINRISDGKAIVSSDVGQHQMWAAQFIRFDAPRHVDQLGRPGLDGLRAAGGGRRADGQPGGKRCFAIAGDGGFQMSVPELATLVNYGLPVKVIVMNNGYLGMVRQWQELFYNNRMCGVELSTFPNVELLAAAYGMKGRIVRTPAELRSALQEAMDEPGPYLMDVRVSQYENVYPMVPAGAAINEMVLAPPQPVPWEAVSPGHERRKEAC